MDMRNMQLAVKTLEKEIIDHQVAMEDQNYKPIIDRFVSYELADYLGHGRAGLVIRVSDAENNQWVLKIQGERADGRMAEGLIGMFLYTGAKQLDTQGYSGRPIPAERNGTEFDVKRDDKLMGVLDYYDVWRFDDPESVDNIITFLTKGSKMLPDDKLRTIKVWNRIREGQDLTRVSQDPDALSIRKSSPTLTTHDYFTVMRIELGEQGEFFDWIRNVANTKPTSVYIHYLEGVLLQVSAHLVGLRIVKFVHGDLHFQNVFVKRYGKTSPNSSLVFEFPGRRKLVWKDADAQFTHVFALGDLGFSGMDIIEGMDKISDAWPHETSYALDLHSLGISIIYEIWWFVQQNNTISNGEASSLVKLLHMIGTKLLIAPSDVNDAAITEVPTVRSASAPEGVIRRRTHDLLDFLHTELKGVVPGNIRAKMGGIDGSYIASLRWVVKGDVWLPPASGWEKFWDDGMFDKFEQKRGSPEKPKKGSPPKKIKITSVQPEETSQVRQGDMVRVLKELIGTPDDEDSPELEDEGTSKIGRDDTIRTFSPGGEPSRDGTLVAW